MFIAFVRVFRCVGEDCSGKRILNGFDLGWGMLVGD